MAKRMATPLAQLQPREAINLSAQTILAANNAPQQCPPFVVPAGATVTLRPWGRTGQNTGVINVGKYYEDAQFGSFALIPAADVVLPWPVDNTGEIWIMGVANDGVVVSVTANSVG
jgi:hypothetical protein